MKTFKKLREIFWNVWLENFRNFLKSSPKEENLWTVSGKWNTIRLFWNILETKSQFAKKWKPRILLFE